MAAIVRELAVSRKVVQEVVRMAAREFAYTRQVQPRPQLGAFAARLDTMLAENAARPRRERLMLQRTADLLCQEGYTGGHDAVRRHARQWRLHQPTSGGQAFAVPSSTRRRYLR
ncbi:MAG: IS21 family transposase, partial [Acetobacteraceae bacterium]|nr:IS21 family transposase [Acetobacteraceae bacterium]